MIRIRLTALFAASLLLASACSGDSTTTTATGDPVTGGTPTGTAPKDVIPPDPGEEPAPEFKATRGAIQPVSETVVDIGNRMATLVQKVESDILEGQTAKADERLIAMVGMLDAPEAAAITDDIRGGVLGALATDLARYSDRAGAPTVKVVEHKDTCCGEGKTCSVPSPGSTCWEFVFEGKPRSCGGICKPADGEAAPDGDAAPPESEGDSAPADEPAVEGGADAAPSSEPAAAPSEPAAAPSEPAASEPAAE